MGLFDFLFGGSRSRARTLDDHIWLTHAAKLDGIRREVAKLAQTDEPHVVLVSHFPDLLDDLAPIAEEAGVPCRALLAEELTTEPVSSWPADETATLSILVAERHPLSTHDDEILQFANSRSCRCQIAFHLSLEDPLMAQFAGEWVQTVLQQLGMTENEPITSNMVTRRFKAAQDKIASKTFGDSRADSAAKWLTENVPDWKPI